MSRVLGNILCGSRSNNVFFCKCIFSLTMGCSNIKLCWYKVPANKLCLFYQMDTGVSPNYLSSLIPASVEDSNIYNLRNANNLRHTLTRTQLYNRPFYPPRAWNELALEVRQSSLIQSLKYQLNKNLKRPPKKVLCRQQIISDTTYST